MGVQRFLVSPGFDQGEPFRSTDLAQQHRLDDAGL